MKIELNAAMSAAETAAMETRLGLPPNTLAGQSMGIEFRPTADEAATLVRTIAHSLMVPGLHAVIGAAVARWRELDAMAAHKRSPLAKQAALSRAVDELVTDDPGPTWPPDELDDLLATPIDWAEYHRQRLSSEGEALAAFWLLDVLQDAAFSAAVATRPYDPRPSPDWLLNEFPIRRLSRRTDLHDALDRLANAVGAAWRTYGSRTGGLAMGAGAAWLAQHHMRGPELAAEFCRVLGHLGDLPAHASPEMHSM